MRQDSVVSRAGPVLRLAHQLTGDPARAVMVAVAALARMPRRSRRSEPELDRLAVAHVVRAARAPKSDTSVVLALGLGWDPATVAEVTRSSARRVRADVADALRRRSDPDWRADLGDPRWELPAPVDLEALVHRERGRRARRSRLRLLALGTVVTALAGSAVAVGRVVSAPGGLPPTAHVPGLLPWPPRGPLAGDPAVLAQAIRAWRSVAPSPAGGAYLLYAGAVGGTRLVVLQGYFEDTPAVAVVTNGRLARLVPLPTTHLPALAVTYDPGSGVDVTRLLVDPAVTGVAVRSSPATVPQRRPPFIARRVTAGLSEPSLTPGLSGPWPAVRLTDRDGVTAVRLISGRTLIPLVARPVMAAPPPRWSGLPARILPPVLSDDALWFAQVCASAHPRVQAIWAGRVPGFASAVRVVRVRCGGVTRVRFLTGTGSRTITLSDGFDMRPRLSLYATVVTPPTTLGHAYVVLVGSRRVAEIRVTHEVWHARVVVVRLERAGNLRVFAADGTRIPVR